MVISMERSVLNALVNATLPPKNGIYAYIRSGAIAEAFLPLYHIKKALSSDEKQQAEQLYLAVAEVYGMKNTRSFATVTSNIQRYLKIKTLLSKLLQDASSKHFGVASVIVRSMDEQPEIAWERLDRIDEAEAQSIEKNLQKRHKMDEAEAKRLDEIEEYFIAAARFSFRDNFQPPLALAYDPVGFLASAEYTTYSALHIVQNYRADWYDKEQPHYRDMLESAQQSVDKQIQLSCEIRGPQEPRLRVYFHCNATLTKKRWEERYCSKLTAIEGLKLRSNDGRPIPAEINVLFEQNYVTFYAVPAIGPEAIALNKLSKITSLFTNTLRVDFGEEGEHEYMFVVGSAALHIAYENNVIGARYMVKKASTRGSHLFDWEEI